MAKDFRQQPLMKDQYNTDGPKAKVCSRQSNHLKKPQQASQGAATGPQEVLSSRSELQQVLERRQRVQSVQNEEGQRRTPLEDVLLRRQQKQLEREKEEEEKVRDEAQYLEYVKVRQNLRKIHAAMQNKAAST